MSKKSKKITKQKNLNIKRARKAANKAMYQARAAEGRNSKSKRSTKRRKNEFNPEKGLHIVDNCGNPGCSKCASKIISERFGARLVGKTRKKKKSRKEAKMA